MINIADLNNRLVQQDEELRATLATLASGIGDESLRAIAEIVAAGLTALHERQGNKILLSMQTGH